MLKELIQRLLDSRTTPAQAAHSAMPKPENSTIISEVIADKGWHSLIAPFDGYFSAKAITNHLLIENSSSQWQGVTALTNAGYMGFTLSMTKGSEVRYQLDPISTGVILSFSRAIGGGVLSYLQGGAICLNNLLHFLRRSSLPTRKNGYQLAQQLNANRLMLSLSPTRTLTHTKTSQLQPTGTSLFVVVRTRLILMCQQVKDLLTKRWDYGRDFPLVLPREIPLVFGCMEARRPLRLSSIQIKVINLRTGGAL